MNKPDAQIANQLGTLLEASPIRVGGKGCAECRIVLVERDTEHQPFVTWRQNTGVEGIGCYYGHYFETLEEAKADFDDLALALANDPR